MAASDANDDTIVPGPGRRRRLSTAGLVLGSAIGLAIGAATTLVFFALRNADRIPELTEERLEAAEALWDSEGPASYDMDLRLTGAQPGAIQIEVRDGMVTAFTRDGVVPGQRRTWDYWTVPAQFDTIARDMELAADPAGPFGLGDRDVVQRAEFDSRFGYPRRYQRIVLGESLDVEWEVTRFQAMP